MNIFGPYMDVVYLVYGVSFLGLGLAITVRRRVESGFELARVIGLLAAFGYIHGTLEWMDLWRVVRGDNPGLAVIRPFVLWVSYILLFEFGRRLMHGTLASSQSDKAWFGLLSPWLHLPLNLLILLGMAWSPQPDLALNIGSRYLLGFTGSVMAGIGFFLHCQTQSVASMNPHDMPRIRAANRMATLAFVAYGLFGGLVVPAADWLPASVLNQDTFFAATGVPVQVVRAFCALMIAISVTILLGVFDIEDRQRLTYALQRAREAVEELGQISHRDELILGSTSEGIFGVDAEGRTMFVNRAAMSMLGYSREELVGAIIHPLTHHTTADGKPYPIEACPIHRTVNEHLQQRVAEDLFWRKDGSSFAVEYESAPMRDGDEVSGAVVVFRDITEQRRIAEASPSSCASRVACSGARWW